MTVAELIEQLKTQPSEAEVLWTAQKLTDEIDPSALERIAVSAFRFILNKKDDGTNCVVILRNGPALLDE